LANADCPAIGVFDSGVGGLSVLRELRIVLPRGNLSYVADSKYVPYGTKSPELIRDRSSAIVRFLVDHRRSRVVVVACNTATTHAVDLLRRDYPTVPIVGTEPAIKPAAHATQSGVVGILATGATLAGERVSNLIERNTEGIDVVTQPCPGLVEQVEAGDLSGPVTIELVRRYTQPLLARGADAIVLGCTHYSFLQETIRRVVGPSVTLLDSAAAVARQTAAVLATAHADGVPREGAAPDGHGVFFTSGDPRLVRPVLETLWGEPLAEVRQLAL
jgi:glutamate racemase